MLPMTQAEIVLEGHTYRIGRLDAMSQFHLSRKLAPMLTTVSSQLLKLLQENKDAPQEEWLVSMMGPISEQAARMPEEDVNYILKIALGAVSREDSGKWARITLASGQLVYGDIEMPTMFRLVVEVVKVNLSGFFKGLIGGTA